jgi:uncharacterized membrane protein
MFPCTVRRTVPENAEGGERHRKAAPLRSRRDRFLQSASEEAGGMLLVSPIYAAIFGARLDESFVLLAAIAALSLILCPLYNTAFDLIELRYAGRISSKRPHVWRIVHAISYEACVFFFEVPVIVALGDHDVLEALALDIGLGTFYVGYGYLFHLGFDRLRPVTPDGVLVD